MEQQNSNQPVSGGNQQIVNTEAAKAKANELLGKAKNGVEYYKSNIKTDKKLWIGTGVAVLVIVLLFVALMGGNGKGVVKKYAKGLIKQDVDAIMEVYHEEYIDYMDKWTDDYAESLEDSFDNSEIEYKSYKIVDEKDYDKDDVEDAAEYLEELYDIDEDAVKDVKRYTVEFVYEEDDDEDEEKVKLYVVKIKGSWYLFEYLDI